MHAGLMAYAEDDLPTALQHLSKAADEGEHGAAILAADVLMRQPRGNKARAAHLLEQVLQSDAPFPTPLMEKYLADTFVEINITPNVVADVRLDGLASTLLLAEVYQILHRIDQAIGLLEQVSDLVAHDVVLRLSLCELYFVEGVWERVIELGANVESEDDMTLAIMIFYARALYEQGLSEAAISVLSKAVRRKKNRTENLLFEGRYWRAKSYERAGKRSRAREELQKLYADAPDFRDVGALLGVN